MSFVVDDFGAWVIGVLADAGWRRLTSWVLGTEQERALGEAAQAAVAGAAQELRPEGGTRAEHLAMVIGQVFSEPMPDEPSVVQATLLEMLHARISSQMAVLDDASLTGTGKSSAEFLGFSGSALAETLTRHLRREIIVRGLRGGPLEPLAAQVNHDVTHLQNQRIAHEVGRLAGEVREALPRLEGSKPLREDGPGPASSLPVRYSLLPDPVAFTGRDAELGRITEAHPGAGEARVYTIVGMPGVGKTALAVHAAHLLRHRFPDGQLFVDLHAHTPGQEPLTAGTALARLLAATGVDPRRLPEDTESQAGLWRDRMAGRRVLLVLDNAGSSAQVAPLLSGSGSSLVLVTSRRHLADLPGGAVPLLLDTLEPAKAQEMFLLLAPRAAGSAAEVAELLGLVGCLPLAISLLARVFARHPSWTLANLIAETRAKVLTLTAEASSVAAAFEVSYQNLAPRQREFFRCLGLHPGTTTDPYGAAALAGTGLDDATEQLDALHGEGLLTETGYRRYGMHDLIRRYARNVADSNQADVREQAMERLLDYYQQTAAIAEARLAFQTHTHPVTAAAIPEAALPDLPDRARAIEWARSERAGLLGCLDYAADSDQHARVVSLTAAMASFLRLDGPWADAITRHTAAAQAAGHLADRPGQASAISEMGIARQQAGDYPGAACAQEDALALYRDAGDLLGQANALSNLGIARWLTRNPEDADQALKGALALYRALGRRIGQAKVLVDLVAIRWLARDYAAAAGFIEEALSLSRYPGDRLNQPDSLSNAGIVRRQTGDYPGAPKALREVLSLYRDLGEQLGDDPAAEFLDQATARRLTGDYPGVAQALEAALGLHRDRRSQADA